MIYSAFTFQRPAQNKLLCHANSKKQKKIKIIYNAVMDTIKTIRKSVVKGMISLTRSRKDGIVL